MHETVIVNTSPLLYLHRLGCIYILEKLYRNIVIPQAVVNELKEGKTVGEDVPAIEDYSWITVKNAGHLTQIKPLMDKLKEAGFYLKDELIREILKNAGE